MTDAPAMPETFDARVVAARPMTERVRRLELERVDGRPFSFAAGQWVSVVLPLNDEKGRPLRRSYSIASAPSVGARFELVVTKVDGGLGSTWLHEVAPGTTLQVKGPQGTFTRPLQTAQPSLLVATGTGVAPFRGMVAEALAAGRPEPMWLLFGVRTERELLYREELEALARAHPQFRLVVSLSRADQSWPGRTGYVQTHVKALWSELSALGGEPRAYVCGVRKMLFSVRDVLRVELGVDRKRVHLESYD